MPSARSSLLPIAILACLFTPDHARGQSARPGPSSDWELNLHGAALRPGLFEESGAALQFGGRLVRNFGSGVSFGASVDWARPRDVALTLVEGVSASMLLYSAELDVRFRVSPRTELFLGAGAGAATLTLNPAPIGVAKTSTGLLVPVGGGIKVLNRAVAPSWALRFDVRDNVILLESLDPDGGVATEPRHNIEGSVGLSFLFGGRGSGEVAADRDTDRDGVPDPRDYCLNRPGVPVDARGCPLRAEPPPALEPDSARPVPVPAVEPDSAGPIAMPAEEPDSDHDGVPDSRDGCLGTGEGTPVQADGCPALPPAPAPAPGDGDGDGVGDDLDACPGTPPGIVVDERGCLAPAAPRQDALPSGNEPGADAPARPLSTCLDPDDERPISFDGRTFRSSGYPQTVDRAFLVRVGTADGLPLYVSDAAVEPYPDFWVPRCGGDDLFDLYVEALPTP